MSQSKPARGLNLRARISTERLEERDVPTALIGLTGANTLVSFDSATPGTVTSTQPVTGLTGGDTLVGIDYRPANAVLYALSNTSRIYTINPATGVATAVTGTPFSPPTAGAGTGFDFNPLVDRIRIVTSSNQNLRVDPASGAVVGTGPDTPPAYDAMSYSDYFGSGTPPTPQIAASGYTTNTDFVTNLMVTTLYDIDTNLDLLVTQGGPDGSPSPNAGALFIVGDLGFDAGSAVSLDIEPGTDAAFVSNGGAIYSLNITTGKATSLGTVGGTASLVGLAIKPPAPGAGALSLDASTFTFSASRTPLAVTVTRGGGATGPATLDFATSDGTALAGTDYLPSSGTLSFADGQTSQQIFLSLPAGPAQASPAKTFTLTLSNATGGATLGATTSATVTIPVVAASPAPRRFTVLGAGAGDAPRVSVLNSITGAVVASFNAFENGFTGGVSVSSGDVNGDGTDDIIVGAGPNGGPRVRVYDGSTITASVPRLLADFFAYEATFTGGINVATGDVNGDGFKDVIVGSGLGGGPRVRTFDGTLLATTQGTLNDFFAYESTFRGGVNVGSGQFNSDGFDDIIAGAGIGGGPRVRIFNSQNLTAALADYFAYDGTLRGGVIVSAADLNGDGKDDVIAGAGQGGGPNVKLFNSTTQNSLGSLFAYDSTLTGGVRIAAADFGADGVDEIVTAAGPGGPRTIKFLNIDGQSKFSFDAFDPSFKGGIFVG